MDTNTPLQGRAETFGAAIALALKKGYKWT